MSDNERLHLFAKDEKGYPFLSIGSCSDKTKKGTLFLSILLSLKTIGKGVKFQDITLIGATFTNTLAAKDSRCTLSAILNLIASETGNLACCVRQSGLRGGIRHHILQIGFFSK